MCAVRNQQPIPNPGKTVAKYIWQSRMNLLEGINLAKLTVSGFEKSSPLEETSW